jgi:hypothetical protein
MKSYWFSMFLANAFLFLYPTGVHAGQCDVVNKAVGETKIEVAGKAERLGAGSWTPLKDCTNLNVIEGGPVQIRGVVGGIPQRVLCERSNPCLMPPTSKSFVISNASSYTLVAGGHRMDDGVVRKFGIPRGELYGLEIASKFDFSSLSESPLAFALFEASGKRPVFKTGMTNGQVSLPLGSLRRGAKYTWEVYGSHGRGEPLATGGFSLMSEESAASVARDISALEQGGKRGLAEQAFDELAVYYAHDLTYEISLLREALMGGKQ